MKYYLMKRTIYNIGIYFVNKYELFLYLEKDSDNIFVTYFVCYIFQSTMQINVYRNVYACNLSDE